MSASVKSTLRVRFYLILEVALLLNVGVELTHLPGRLDMAMEAGLFLVVAVMVLLLYLGESSILKR